MPLLDIEKIISAKKVGSRFRLVSLASQRARELNEPNENTASQQSAEYLKVTTNALNEIIKDRLDFTDKMEDEKEESPE